MAYRRHAKLTPTLAAALGLGGVMVAGLLGVVWAALLAAPKPGERISLEQSWARYWEASAERAKLPPRKGDNVGKPTMDGGPAPEVERPVW